jgi:hypothetical protein
LFGNRLTTSFDVYNALSEDVLVFLELPRYLGGSGRPAVNAATIKNTGVEFAATYRSNPTTSHLIKWDISGNFTTIKNRVLAVGNQGVDAAGNKRDYIPLDPNDPFIAKIGLPIGAWYVVKTNGIFQSQQEIDNYVNKNGVKIQPSAKPGDVKYVDFNEDGTINSADRQYAGSPWPTLQTGLQFNAIIKQFSFNLQLVGIFGNKIYNDIRRNLDSYQVTNFRSDLDPWSPTHTSGEDPRLVEGSDPSVSANNMGQSDRWLESGSYVRVRNLEIAYQLPKTLLDRANFSNGRIFISGQNLFTITKYKGLDPDVQGVGIIARGLDAGNWPSSRVISFGIVADF